VFVHGVLANAELWRNVVPRVAAAGYTCIAPDWPLGAHVVPMRADADLRPGAVAGLVTEFLDVLDLEDVTLVANDAGGAITLLLVANGADRVGRIVLTSGDCFEYFFPRIFWPLQVLPRIPGGLTALVHAMRLRPLHRLPMAFGRLTKRPMSPQATDHYLLPSRHDRLIRRDLRRFLLGVDNRLTLDAATRLHNFDGPVLLAWSAEDKLFPISLAHRLAAIFPDATVRPIDDSFTFSPEDQPDQLADMISGFLTTDAGYRRPRRATARPSDVG
jgi:pimeloyl-ACP methyl ester carboxylesterase